MIYNIFATIFLVFFFSQRAHGGAQVGSENTFFIQGSMGAGIKSRNYAMLGWDSFKIGPVAYFDQPYAKFTETILGGGLRFGSTWLLGFDGGILERKVYDLSGQGFGASLVLGYSISDWWHVSCPIVYHKINSGDLAKRSEVSIAPFIGVHLGK